ncbi:hypothetical protein [Methylovulum psychrotolerans]|nr:hypothetical protein [Methylovulum psychrotolerans]
MSVNLENYRRFMQKRGGWRVFWWGLGWVMVVCAGLVVGVFFYHEDHRAEIAKALLFGGGNGSNLPVVNAALAARFPVGSQLADVVAFAEGLGGHCEAGNEGERNCFVGLSSSFCVASNLVITVALAADRSVSSVKAYYSSFGC